MSCFPLFLPLRIQGTRFTLHRPGPPSGSSQVEWYQAGAAAVDYRAAAGPADYSYNAMGGASTSAAAYGSFEEEAPLLEGTPSPYSAKHARP